MSLVLMESCDLPNSDSGVKWASGPTDNSETKDGRTCWGMGVGRNLRSAVFDGKKSASVTFGCRYYPSGLYGYQNDRPMLSVASDGGATWHVGIYANGGDGSVTFRRGSTILATSDPGVYSANAWQYFELQVTIDDSSGSFDFRVDGQSVLSGSGLDTKNGGSSALVDAIAFGVTNSGAGLYAWIRDIYWLNDSGSDLNDFLGPVVVEAVLPDGAGDLSGFTPNGAASNYQCVDESDPDGDTTYVDASGAAVDTYTVGDLSNITKNPLAVAACAIARYDASPLDLATVVRRSGTTDAGTADTPAGSYGSLAYSVWEEDPVAASEWTLANFNASQFGLQAVP